MNENRDLYEKGWRKLEERVREKLEPIFWEETQAQHELEYLLMLVLIDAGEIEITDWETIRELYVEEVPAYYQLKLFY